MNTTVMTIEMTICIEDPCATRTIKPDRAIRRYVSITCHIDYNKQKQSYKSNQTVQETDI